MSQDDQMKAMQRFESILAEARRFSNEASAFYRIVRTLSTPEGYTDLKRVERALQKLAALKLAPSDLASQAAPAAEDTSAWLSDEWQRRAGRFASELTLYLSERNIQAIARGDCVDARPFTMEIEGSRDRAQLTYAGEAVGKPVPLSAPVIYRAYTEAEKRLKRDEKRPEQFADDLVHAYRDACRLREMREGVRVRLPDVHFALFVRWQTAASRSDPRARRIVEYPRYQFAWDLGLLRESPNWLQRHHIELHEATDAASCSRANSVRVVARDGTEVVLGNMQVSGR